MFSLPISIREKWPAYLKLGSEKVRDQIAAKEALGWDSAEYRTGETAAIYDAVPGIESFMDEFFTVRPYLSEQ